MSPSSSLAAGSNDTDLIIKDASLRQFTGYHMKRAYNVLRSDLARCLEPFGLRITTYSTLNLIVENPGVRQSELALALDIERPNMVVILDDLEQRGWVDRRRVETDRRAYALYATLSGQRVCKKAIAADRASEGRLLKHLNAQERETLLQALNKIENAAGA